MSEPSPLFSIVLPSYNRSIMLRAAIESVLAQTCRDYECFVLDDGSTDRTPDVFREFSGEPKFAFFRFEDNRRQHARRNFAIARAQGRFVTFLDSDDLWLPERLDIFRRAIESRPAVGFWFSNGYVFSNGKITGTVFHPRRPISEGRVPGWYAVGGDRLPYLTTNVAIARSAFADIGLFREDMRVLEDTELYARMLGSGIKIGVIRAPLAARRLHPDQITMEHERAYQESLTALASGGISASDFVVEKKRLALATAGYLVKSLEPDKARRFLKRELGQSAARHAIYWASFLPRPALSAAKWVKTMCGAVGSHPVLAPNALREASRQIKIFLDVEIRKNTVDSR
ncbi:MAG: glycosyltransferase family 2 protein [Elusimicrobiota bacterium]